MAEERPKININSLSDLKNTTDDAIPNYLNSVGYRRIHTIYYDYNFGFEAVTLYPAYHTLP
ncbi:hypothetical protein BGX38DRAFT_1274352 [Terfezia claveryi]|nr:hypothetical protein BGX38DRAFT_1274352 [Terfezia claveryi]